MSTNKILLAGLAGGVVYLLLGYVVYGMALSSFFEANQGTATGVMKAPEDMIWWAMILGNLSFGLLIAVIFGRWASISTWLTGAKAGAVIGFLMTFGWDFMMYSYSNIANLTSVIVDVVVGTVLFAIVGAVVGWVLGYGKK